MELERLFRQIVVNLAAVDPARLRRPLPLADIRHSIVPYRANRRALQIESSEEYELALMRLCAGQNGLARTDPGEIQEAFASEVRSPNPDLALVERHEKALLSLDPVAVDKVMNANPDLAYAPRESAIVEPVPEPSKPVKRREESNQVQSNALRCTRCGVTLPAGRVVNFCPQCGQNLTRRYCPQCNTELEAAWRHCVSCGTPVAPARH